MPEGDLHEGCGAVHVNVKSEAMYNILKQPCPSCHDTSHMALQLQDEQQSWSSTYWSHLVVYTQ